MASSSPNSSVPKAVMHIDVLDLIIQQLVTARDVASLSATSHFMYDAMYGYGWRTFMNHRFPSIRVPPSLHKGYSYAYLSGLLSKIDRAFEQRAFDIHSYGEHPTLDVGYHYRNGKTASVTHTTPLDAKLTLGSNLEMVACGVGPDLMIKKALFTGQRPNAWQCYDGRSNGTWTGRGDITALSIMNRGIDSEVIIGRANGQFHVQRVQAEYVAKMSWLPLHRDGAPKQEYPAHPSLPLDLIAISSIDHESTNDLVGTCQHDRLRVYNLSGLRIEDRFELWPVLEYDAASPVQTMKFLDSRTIACGLENEYEALLCGQITPDGKLRMQSVSRFYRNSGKRKTVHAIEPVGPNGEQLLTAWSDGSIRLTDLRTPSPYVSMYRNGLDPDYASGSLTTHGQERFIAGSLESPEMYFFDYRSPAKAYHHTDALPCSPIELYPAALQLECDQTPIHHQIPKAKQKHHRCDYANGTTCAWHRVAKLPESRPDVAVLVDNTAFEHVTALARACDFSDVVYCGMRGAVLEIKMGERMSKRMAEEGRSPSPSRVDANARRFLGDLDAKTKSWKQRQRPQGDVKMDEFGVGLCEREIPGAASRVSAERMLIRDGNAKEKSCVQKHFTSTVESGVGLCEGEIGEESDLESVDEEDEKHNN